MPENSLVLEAFEIIGDELAIRWKNGEESYIRLEALRRNCPCAICAGETDLLGQKYGGSPNLSAKSFALRSCSLVGSYGLQPVWADGHSTGIYSYQLLQKLGEGTV
ncbi:MAG: DUF971 domain-containing protein [Verrucomicrobia bacterium]|nr:DUF971 domain-containing protein [Verrucomicrobiota bacterium]MBV9276402.1 DUF971 domain-containing protein [Verrucomicrobiota bacterium]